MSIRLVSLPRCWQCLFLLVGVFVLVSIAATPSLACDQDDEGDVSGPVVVIGRMRANWWVSANDEQNREGVLNACTIAIPVYDRQRHCDASRLYHVDGRSVRNSSCSLRC